MSALEISEQAALGSASTHSGKFKTTVYVNLAGTVERMDEQILPALYNFVGQSFSASPSQLGTLTLCRALVQALSSPISGLSGHLYNRVQVISIGCCLWGICTAGFSMCQSLKQGYIFWAVNGIGLSLVIPTGQSLIADYYQASDRGKAFGVMLCTSSMGGMIGSLYATNLGSISVFGREGWRCVFLSVALVSIIIGALTWRQAQDPRYGLPGKAKLHGAAAPNWKEIWREVKAVMSIPTFQLVVVQGVIGSIPWSALVFLTLYMQLMGMSDFQASMLMSMFLGAYGLGTLIGGWVGDAAACRFPDHGRVAVTQFSEFTRIPISWLIIKGLPNNGEPGTVAMYAFALVLMNCLGTWAAPACNNPAFAEIVPPHMRNIIFAFDRCFEGAIAACAAPLVGTLAERQFGFTGTAARSGDAAVDAAKARALGDALVPFLIVPWTCSLIIYTGLHITYPKDRQADMLTRPLDASSLKPTSFQDTDPDASNRPMLADSQHSNSDHAHSPSSSVILGNSDSADAAPNSTSQEEITGHSENGLDTDDDGRGSSVELQSLRKALANDAQAQDNPWNV